MLELWVKALHVIAVIAWMAGLLYLPRLFVYHAEAPAGSAESDTFKTMERRLQKAIMRPAMLVVLLTGAVLAYQTGYWKSQWLHAKVILVLALVGLHIYFSRCVRVFAADGNQHSPRFFRFLNETPTILMIGIVILVVVKPF